MKTPLLYNMLNLRKPVSHITFLIFSFLVTAIIALSGKYDVNHSFSFSIFIMLFAQLEVFIYLGSRIFGDLNFDKSPGEITRIVLVRFCSFWPVACLHHDIVFFTAVCGILD